MDKRLTGNGEDSEVIEISLIPRVSELTDELKVQRALPSARRRMVGPFIFVDRFGPATLGPGHGLDVRPHPHIGLATLTWLLDGVILHRDSLGFVQPIQPGEVNWMTAGRGIVHSERTPPEQRATASPLSGLQTWLALPQSHEETDPGFEHHGAAALPVLEGEGMRLLLIAGSFEGRTSPVRTLTDTLYADVSLAPGATLSLSGEHEERAMVVLEGAVEVAPGGGRFEPGPLVVFRPGARIELTAREAPARLMLLGGEPMDGPRHIWWNFVSSSRERIEQAKADWRAGRFAMVPGETEFIPLPDD